jgi:hypothetical protein
MKILIKTDTVLLYKDECGDIRGFTETIYYQVIT